MKRSIELLVATATAPGASGIAGTAVAGDSLTIKNGSGARILQCWSDHQGSGIAQIIRNTSGHDTTRDLRYEVVATELSPHQPMGIPNELAPQELLSLLIAGSSAGGDVETLCMLIEYDDLKGLGDQNLIDWDTLKRRLVKTCNLDVSLTAAVGPAFATSEELITAETDLLKANSEYAVVGYKVRQECAAVYIRGSDTANVRIGGPGNDLDARYTTEWFSLLSRAYDRPMIPVINTGNKGSTFVGCHQDENAGTVNVTFILALLK